MHRQSLIILLITLLPILLLSQEDKAVSVVRSPTHRPKIGLVLSGGSAHGLSHIGVLKFLEERGIHVDYVTGTSMGSIIGGLYAMGLSAEEIEEVAGAQDWSSLLSTSVPMRQIAPVEKKYHNRYPLTLEYDEDGLRLPLGFLNSQNLDLTLNRLFRAAHAVNDFDSLPYPFRCMTVDIENGEVVELKNGFLGNAVRASMAIPSVFTPVDRDNRLLVDGGLIRNFPVEEARQLGAEIIIGVYVGSKLDNKDKLNSLVDVLNQSAFMMGILDSEEQKKNVDILIEPDVKDLPNFGFDLYEELIEGGYAAARSVGSQIDSLAALYDFSTENSPAKLRTPEAVALKHTRFPFVRQPFDALARFKYGINRDGSTSFDRIEKGISRIFGTKHFNNINYSFHRDARGDKTMDILAQPRQTKSFSFGLNYMPSSGTSLLLTNELRNILSKPSVLYTTVRVAENYGGLVDYQYRLGEKKDFLFNVSVLGHRYDQELYEAETIKERYSEVMIAGKVGVGYEPNNVLMGNGYLAIENFFLNPREERDEDFQGYDRIDLRIGADLNLNTLDERQFPNLGIEARGDVSYHLNTKSDLKDGQRGVLIVPEDKSYLSGQLKVDGYYPIFDQLVVTGHINTGYKSEASLTNNYRIGGLEDRDLMSISMIGLNTHQLHYRDYVQVGGSLRLRLGKSLYVAARYDRINGSRTFLIDNMNPDVLRGSLWGAGGIVSLRTPVGPLHVSYGKNDLTDSWNTNFTFGYSFF